MSIITDEKLTELSKEPVSSYKFKNFKRSLDKYVMTTRFTNITYQENKSFRENEKIKKKNIHCVYNVTMEIKKIIPLGAPMFVLEMNNCINKIMGVGYVENYSRNRENLIHDDGNYNRYSYKGTVRLDHTEFTELEQDQIKVIEKLCFYGSDHLKRQGGITQFPLRKHYQLHEEFDLTAILQKMIDRKYIKNIRDKK